VGHLEKNGFRVARKDVGGSRLQGVKREFRVPRSLDSCHTAVVQGYVIEGHVPADLIKKVLADKPSLLGLGVAGMPIGSPGMEGSPPQPYNVMAFDKNGDIQLYAHR